jgi:hypothetical protein
MVTEAMPPGSIHPKKRSSAVSPLLEASPTAFPTTLPSGVAPGPNNSAITVTAEPPSIRKELLALLEGERRDSVHCAAGGGVQVELLERGGVRYLECAEPIGPGDAMDLVAACLERDARGVLLEARHLPPAFFDLRSGFAGELLQKFQNYGLRLAGVCPSEEGYGERVRELLREARRGRGFRSFATRDDAEAWLAQG